MLSWLFILAFVTVKGIWHVTVLLARKKSWKQMFAYNIKRNPNNKKKKIINYCVRFSCAFVSYSCYICTDKH